MLTRLLTRLFLLYVQVYALSTRFLYWFLQLIASKRLRRDRKRQGLPSSSWKSSWFAVKN